jgi:aminoglycoside phosphotransferase (APT) family kinase protein
VYFCSAKVLQGDLYCRHLLFDQGKLSGIIDWGDMEINHKVVDLSVIWSFYPTAGHSVFLKTYGEVDPDTWQYARFLALYLMLTVLLYAHDIGEPLLIMEVTRSIRCINRNLIKQ